MTLAGGRCCCTCTLDPKGAPPSLSVTVIARMRPIFGIVTFRILDHPALHQPLPKFTYNLNSQPLHPLSTLFILLNWRVCGISIDSAYNALGGVPLLEEGNPASPSSFTLTLPPHTNPIPSTWLTGRCLFNSYNCSPLSFGSIKQLA